VSAAALIAGRLHSCHLFASPDIQVLSSQQGVHSLTYSLSRGLSIVCSQPSQDELGTATDVPVLKLFEFLVASICLFMVEVRHE
jgi:hypothetical protein